MYIFGKPKNYILPTNCPIFYQKRKQKGGTNLLFVSKKDSKKRLIYTKRS